jgi:hypothetical protein
LVKDREMKKAAWTVIVLGIFLFTDFGVAGAEDFLGAPVIPDGKVVLKTKKRLEMFSPLSHDEVLAYYREALKKAEDIKYRDWSDQTYIEDDGALKWHSITIAKEKTDQGTSIVIVKDNWTWIIGTLILRFVGVFVVLLALFLCMSISGTLISRYTSKAEPQKT